MSSTTQFVLTPYQCTKVFNEHRVSLGLKVVQSPFMYIQARKRRFQTRKVWNGRKYVLEVDRQSWQVWAYEHNMRQARRAQQAGGAADLGQRAIEAPKSA